MPFRIGSEGKFPVCGRVPNANSAQFCDNSEKKPARTWDRHSTDFAGRPGEPRIVPETPALSPIVPAMAVTHRNLVRLSPLLQPGCRGLYVFSLRYNTYMSKLTLSVDDRVVASAKRYARQRGISVSRMVEAYLASVANPDSQAIRDAPILRSLRGSLKKADFKEYRKHLAIKYR